MSDDETLKVYAEKVDEYANLVTRGTPDQDLQNFIDMIPDGGRVLDLGCGPGNSAAMMADAGLVADAWDASPEMIDLAAQLPGISTKVAKFSDLDLHDHYDGIWANFSLLHAPKADIPDHLARIAAALKPGGALHIGLKTGLGEKRDRLGRFYSYFSEPELRELLAPHSFDILSVRHSEGTGLDGSVAPFMILKARLP